MFWYILQILILPVAITFVLLVKSRSYLAQQIYVKAQIGYCILRRYKLDNLTMGFIITLENTEHTAKIVLSGSLNSSSILLTQAEVRKVSTQASKTLLLQVSELQLASSAGWRKLIFARQKVSASTPFYFVEPQRQILDPLQMAGIIHSAHLKDSYPN